MTTRQPHISVLLQETLDALLAVQPQRVIDGTLGAGGHTQALLDAGVGELLGLDLDPQALAIARERLAAYGERAHIVQSSYADMTEVAHDLGWQQVDGILLDLGVSSMQLDTPERGFAFRFSGPLDMRFDPQNDVKPSASELVNTWDEQELADIFFRYGEERDSRRFARALVQARQRGETFTTTDQLAAFIESLVPRHKRGDIHPATRIFQALRIAVNDELGILEQTLPQAIDLLSAGGRLAVISFHSLEDRIVKQVFKQAATDCICPPQFPVCVCGHEATVKLVTPKPLVAAETEAAQNPRSRSAKLRVVEKLSQ